MRMSVSYHCSRITCPISRLTANWTADTVVSGSCALLFDDPAEWELASAIFEAR
jgi:hypothetical protein